MTHRPTALRRTGLLLATAALAATGLAACGGDSEETPEADPSSELTLDESPSDPASVPEGVPTEPPEAPTGLQNDDSGAKAFAEYAFRVYQFSVATRDLSPLLALGACPSCDFAREAIAEMKREGHFEIPDEPIKIRSVQELFRRGNKIAMGVSYSLPPGKEVSEDGEVIKELDAAGKKFMEVGVVWKGDSWQLFDLSITE